MEFATRLWVLVRLCFCIGAVVTTTLVLTELQSEEVAALRPRWPGQVWNAAELTRTAPTPAIVVLSAAHRSSTASLNADPTSPNLSIWALSLTRSSVSPRL